MESTKEQSSEQVKTQQPIQPGTTKAAHDGMSLAAVNAQFDDFFAKKIEKT